MNPESFYVLPDKVQQLIHNRTGHLNAVAAIDATLANITKALGVIAPENKTVGVSGAQALKPLSGMPKRKRTKVVKNGLTAGEFVLDFVKAQKNPTSREINTAWKTAGRAWTADVILSQLVKAGKLTRTPLGVGMLGSRYSVAS